MKIKYFSNNKAAEQINAELPNAERINVELPVEELRRAQTWGRFHIVTVDITNDKGETQRYILEIGTGDTEDQTHAYLTAMVGKKETKERVSKRIRAGWVNFKARLEELTKK